MNAAYNNAGHAARELLHDYLRQEGHGAAIHDLEAWGRGNRELSDEVACIVSHWAKGRMGRSMSTGAVVLSGASQPAQALGVRAAPLAKKGTDFGLQGGARALGGQTPGDSTVARRGGYYTDANGREQRIPGDAKPAPQPKKPMVLSLGGLVGGRG